MVFASCHGTFLLCFLRVRSSSPRISRFNAIFKSFCPLSGTHWNEIRRNIVIKTTQVHHAEWRWLSQRANFASSQGLNTHWLPHTTLDLTTKRNDWGWATNLKHEARTPNTQHRSPKPEARSPKPEAQSLHVQHWVNTEKVVEGGSRLHRIVLLHYFTLLKFPNICLLVICVQLKASELSLGFIREIFHSDSLVSFLTGFNDGQYCKFTISSLFLKNFMHELIISTLSFFFSLSFSF